MSDLYKAMSSDDITKEIFYDILLPKLKDTYVVDDNFINFNELITYPNIEYYIKKMIKTYDLNMNMLIYNKPLIYHALEYEWYELASYLLRNGVKVIDDDGNMIMNDMILDDKQLDKAYGFLMIYYEKSLYMKLCLMCHMKK